MSEQEYMIWDVKLSWQTDRGSYEAGGQIAFPLGTTLMEAIQGVAELRNVDLSVCHRVEASVLRSYPWER